MLFRSLLKIPKKGLCMGNGMITEGCPNKCLFLRYRKQRVYGLSRLSVSVSAGKRHLMMPRLSLPAQGSAPAPRLTGRCKSQRHRNITTCTSFHYGVFCIAYGNISKYISSLALMYPANRFSIAERLCFT